ncbi:MAG: cupin domain-containing protein [Euryarchaeota archaeon]|nr:cupin domain-containing protein [Euryarchaeota archaeon]
MKHIRASEIEWIEGRGYQKRKTLESWPLPANVSLVQEVRFPKGSSVPPHYHLVQTEIFYALSPGSIVIDDQEIIMEKGDIVICEPEEVHGMPLIEEDFAFLVMKIDYREDDTVWP